MGIEGRTGHGSLRPLTKTELDRSMQRLADELVAPPHESGESEPAPAMRPRWITAAELVRRVAPFTGRN